MDSPIKEMKPMDTEAMEEKLEEFKEKKGLKDVVVFDGTGGVDLTTQEDDFRVEETYYFLISDLVNIVSREHEQNSWGVTIELENTEFFLHYTLMEGPIEEDKIIGIEYEPESLRREERKSIIFDIQDLLLHS